MTMNVDSSRRMFWESGRVSTCRGHASIGTKSNILMCKSYQTFIMSPSGSHSTPSLRSSEDELTPGPQHLNPHGCVIRTTRGKGRGVYASHPIPRNTLLEVSPVLFFEKEEYENHGKHTIVDHYTFTWMDGRMALALGLGSLFNHSNKPNVTFTLDKRTDSIRYTTVRDVNVDEELCIFYGHSLWFEPAGIMNTSQGKTLENPYDSGSQDVLIEDQNLPFTRYKLPPEEEEPGSIRTINAWVIDIPDSRHITTMLKWIKKAGLEMPDLGHLKRVRKQNDTATLLLSTGSTAPQLPADLDLPDPVQILVPSSAALTPPSLVLKTAIWPTMYTPRRKGEFESWSRGKARWAWNAMKATIEAAIKAREAGEFPIAAHIPVPYEESSRGSTVLDFTACDTRRSDNHPLRHAAINVVRRMADHRAESDISRLASPDASTDLVVSSTISGEESQKGSNYLLTSLTLFITHEPCIMCSMALLHSRVKEVVYLYPMEKTGGCGGSACLPTLKGINHRYSICVWDNEKAPVSYDTLYVDAAIDG
ncbi:hypothetical protein BDQ17DRAFT_603491 [Cyathus striatus]|nr:hypothetical protein BDQ17DRAFT_603491 [Cyathus striatus]